MHNRLLFIDGLDKDWEEGVKSYWEKTTLTTNRNDVPFAINRLNTTNSSHVQEAFETCPQCNTEQFDKYTVDGKRMVSKIPLKLFQERLVEHFDIRYKSNTIVWPRRMKNPE